MVNVGEITAHLVLETNQFNQGMQSAQNSMNSASQSANATSKSIDKIHQAALAVGAVVVGTFAASVGAAANFEQKMKDIEAVAGATGSEMEQLGDLAKEMGQKTAFSASEAAMGIEELVKAGVSVTDILNGGLEGALNLATAGGLQLAEASEIASTALNAFKDDNLTVADSANILAGAANASATDVREMKFGLSQVSAVAAGAGLSFQDTATALAAFAMNGLKGSDAGTSLKTMLQNLQPRTEEQIGLFEELGLMTKEGANAFYDMNGEIKSMPEIAGLLQKSMKDMTDQQRSFALETIFGSDAVRAGNILFKEGAEGLNEMWAAMSKVTAADVAETKLQTLNGAFEELRGSVETIGIKIGEDFLPILTQITRQAVGFVRSIDDVDLANLKAALSFGGAAAAVALVATSVGKLTLALRVLSASPIGLAITGASLLAGAFAAAAVRQREMSEVTLKNADAMLKSADSLKVNIDEYDRLRDKSALTTEQLGRFLDINSEIRKTADPTVIAKLREEQDKLREKSGLSNEEFQKMVDLNGKIIEVVPNATAKITDQGNAILDSTDKARAFNDEQYEMIRLELETQKAKAESKMSQYLLDEKRIIGEIKSLKKDMAVVDADEEKQLRTISKLEADLSAAKKAGDDGEAGRLQYNLALELNKLQKIKDQRAESAKLLLKRSEEIQKIQDQIGKLDEVKRKMVDLELKQAGINAKRGEEIKTIDTSISKLEAAKKKLQETTPIAQRNTGEYRNSIEAIDSQIAKLQGAKNKIGEIIGRAAVMNAELGKAINKNVTVNTRNIEETIAVVNRGRYGSPRENYHVGGIVGMPKLHVGGLASQFAQAPNHNEIDTRLLRNEMVLTQAQQANLFRMIDAGFTPKKAPAETPVSNEKITVEVPVILDGVEVARLTVDPMSEMLERKNQERKRRSGRK
jgi:TP901 family phage tail tape measure protein